MSIIDKAKEYALDKHKNQTYGNGKHSYEYHLSGVVENVMRYTDDKNIIASAWLHDTIEDCEVTFCDLKNIFGIQIARIVSCLSREKVQSYYEYILSMLSIEDGYIKYAVLCIKLSDLEFNINQSDENTSYNRQRKDKYYMAMHILLGEYQKGINNENKTSI